MNFEAQTSKAKDDLSRRKSGQGRPTGIRR